MRVTFARKSNKMTKDGPAAADFLPEKRQLPLRKRHIVLIERPENADANLCQEKT